MKHTIKQELTGVLTFIGVIWVSFLADLFLPWQFTSLGITPRTLWGLFGIPLSPFLHVNFSHLLGNTVPLFLLLVLLAGSRTQTWETVGQIILLSGGLLWLLGRPHTHAGASGLIYGLIAFLIVAGIREKRLGSLVVAVLVGFLYGGTLIFGVLPTAGADVSWDGHLLGALAGAAVAYWQVAREPKSARTTDVTI